MSSNYQVNDIIKVKVTDTKPYAAFVVSEDGRKGLLHISEISDNFIRDIEKFISKGDEVNVKVLEIDEKDGFLRVSYKQVSEDKKFTNHHNGRRLPEIDEDDFKPLAEHLDGWIKDAERKMEDEKK